MWDLYLFTFYKYSGVDGMFFFFGEYLRRRLEKYFLRDKIYSGVMGNTTWLYIHCLLCISLYFQTPSGVFYIPEHLTHKQLEMYGRVLNTLATDGLVLWPSVPAVLTK